MSNSKIKVRKTFPLKLTKFELLHLRDLFSVVLPPTLKETVSGCLAKTQNRVMIEAKLWQKVAKACNEADLPMDDDAPDFIVAATGPAPMGIFELAQEEEQGQDDEDDEGGNLFVNESNVDTDEEDDEEGDDGEDD